MRKKKKLIIIITIILLLIASSILIFLSVKKLDVKYEKEITLNPYEEYYNIDNMNVKNGKIITKKELIDTNNIGEIEVKIEVEDILKRIQTYTYIVEVKDTLAPTITFKEELEVSVGKNIDLLKDVTATDNYDEDVELQVEGEYNLKKSGEYKLSYVAKDTSGNEAKEEFLLRVVENTSGNTTNDIRPDATFTTSKGFSGETKNGITYIDGYLIANKTYSLPANYGNGLTSETTKAFNEMKSAASLEGLNIYISSGFRSYETQDIIYNRYVARDGKQAADTYSARPGHSEHQTGLAFDVNTINSSFANTKEGIWLKDNCYKYGFILRYPEGKTNETGYIYEPWHFRYVGTELAEILYNNGEWLTMEDYFGITSSYE